MIVGLVLGFEGSVCIVQLPHHRSDGGHILHGRQPQRLEDFTKPVVLERPLGGLQSTIDGAFLFHGLLKRAGVR